jgi:ribonuclease R
MPERYADAILKYVSSREYQPLKPRQLARQMNIADEDYGTFRQAVKQLHDSGRIVLGAKDAITLPDIGARVVGFFRANPRGFGFITPEQANAHGDLFVPPDATGGAVNGDLVAAKVIPQGKRDGQRVYRGQVTEILRRGQNRFVGTLERTAETWFVLPEGRQMATPIVVRDISAASPPKGAKVVVEIIAYGAPGELHTGVIVETLGEQGELAVETRAVIRAHGLAEEFSPESLAEARAAAAGFDGSLDKREDLRNSTVITIDPPDARDFDDAISLRQLADGWELGVHIADVSHFVREGGELDKESRARSTSVYFPRRVVPMLPELLSNGVCSLQENQDRYALSAFIAYDAQGNVAGAKFARTLIRSAKRLTYVQAQDILDGRTGGYAPAVVELVGRLGSLARTIEARRRKAGMLHLDLPAVELVLDDRQRVVDAVAEDQSYTHTVIEMFMVEANEAVARLLDRLGRGFLRRIHPDPDVQGSRQLASFVKACGHHLPQKMSRRDMQDLLAAVKGKPESYAVNLALLKTFEQAEYSPMPVGHFALASEHYCHFTSPIRRYPDLTVHRLLTEHCLGRLSTRPPEDVSELVRLGEHCSAAERRAQAAESELREVLVLQLLATRVGEVFDGVVTGVTNFGMFVQSPKFLIDGLIRMNELGDDWWEIDAKIGQVRGERTGRRYRIGDVMKVRIAAVDVARRQLNLVPERDAKPAAKQSKHAPKGRRRRRR